MQSKTRFSATAPNLGADVESFISVCLGCTGVEDEAVPHECAQAVTALSDLAAEIQAGKR